MDECVKLPSVEHALFEWSHDISEPPRGHFVGRDGMLYKKRGDSYTDASSFRRADPRQSQAVTARRIISYIEDGLGWSKSFYTNNGNINKGGFQWCGAFMAFCFAQTGLAEDIRKSHCASTYRLFAFCKGTPRSVPLDSIQAGDVVVVGKKGSKRWGSHITLCTQVNEEEIETIEGNAHGWSGGGKWVEGVVKRKRPFKEYAEKGESYIMHAYRWLEEDFEE